MENNSGNKNMSQLDVEEARETVESKIMNEMLIIFKFCMKFHKL